MAKKVSKNIAHIYAVALYDVAAELQIITEIEQQMIMLSDAGASDVRLRRFLETPTIGLAEKRKVIDTVLDKVHPILRHFLCLLIDNGRIGVLDQIVEAFHEHANDKAGIREVHVVTAQPLEAGDQERLQAALQHIAVRKVVLKPEVNPKLLGGMLLTTHIDRRFDATLSHRLDRMVKKMAAAKSGQGLFKD